MLRASLAGLLAIPLSICGAGAIEITQVKGKFSCPDLDNQQLCAERFEKEFVRRHPIVLLREKGHLKIRLHGGRYFPVLARNQEDENFNVLELQANGRFVVIRQQFYEGNSWQVLDLEKGNLTEIYGYPLFSPDDTRFAAASEDLEAGYSNNVLDVYEVRAAGTERVFRAVSPKKPEWAARDIRWDGNDVIRFSQTRYTGNPPTGYDERPAYLSFQNGNWTLHGDKAH